jgi:DNA-binding protein WhiA
MSFTKEVKLELINGSLNETEKVSLLSGLLKNLFVKGKISTENLDLARFIQKLLGEHYNIKITARAGYNFNSKMLYIIEVPSKKLETTFQINESVISPYLISDEESKKAYIKGVFLSAGSINNPKTAGYHLEFFLSDEVYANFFSELLNEFNLNSKVIKRDNKYAIYIKEAEKIGDFLRLMGGVKALFYFEDIRIFRDYKNMTNRLNNCEQANEDKVIFKADENIRDIELIEKVSSLDVLSDKVKEVALYRQKYPESSISELSEIMTAETGKKITKSGVYHRLKKISAYASSLRK